MEFKISIRKQESTQQVIFLQNKDVANLASNATK